MPSRRLLVPILSLLVALGSVASAGARTPPDGARVDLTLLETTDVHAHLLGYDYYRQAADPRVGLSRTATLIHRARARFANTLLFDDGDAIQGSVLADYQALAHPVPCRRELAVYRAMDSLGYAAATLGNHEFNYGLPYLAQVTGHPMDVTGVPQRRCAGPHFPLVLSNVFSARDGKPIYAPWRIVETRVTATTPGGRTIRTTLRVGVLGFAPPPIMQWDKRHLHGRVSVDGVVEAARRFLPALRARHPDLVVALLHGGLDDAPYTPDMENAGLYLARVPGIDALLLGHQHLVFPGPRFDGLPGVDDARGTVHGLPAVMGGFFGSDLGLVHLVLVRRHGRWVSESSQARSEVWPICRDGHCVPADPSIRARVARVQKAAVAYVNTPIGHTDVRLSSVFADLGRSHAVAIVNAAQRAYVRRWIKANRPDLAGLPVLSAAAAFRNGGSGPGDYTDVAPGPLTLRNAADLYYYPNTLAAVRVDGAVLKAWLERAAGRFRRIDPQRTTPQPLVDPRFPGYDFDQIQGGVHYLIDVSRPRGRRIRNLTYRGKPVQPGQIFIVATNSYRANGGGHFPGLDGHATVLAAPDANRAILEAWIRHHPRVTPALLPAPSWRFARLNARGPVTVKAPPHMLDRAHAAGLVGLRRLHADADGRVTYAVPLGH